MDKKKLRKEATEMRQALLNEGIVDDYFQEVETIEENEPHFVENIIVSFLSESAKQLNEIQHLLDAETLDLDKVNYPVLCLKGGSAMIGARKFNAIVDEMYQAFKLKDKERLCFAFEDVIVGYGALKLRLTPYVELLGLIREDVAPDQESETKGLKDSESVGSNNN